MMVVGAQKASAKITSGMTHICADEKEHDEDVTVLEFIPELVNRSCYMEENIINNPDGNIQSPWIRMEKILLATKKNRKKFRFCPGAAFDNIEDSLSLKQPTVPKDELSIDPRVRRDPWSPPPENEILLTKSQISVARQRRLYFLSIHILACFGLYCCLTGKVGVYTALWTLFLESITMIGIVTGTHRLWSHRSYKATWQLRLILAIFQTIGIQFSILMWVKDHRLHHKFSDTDADPHNSKRGFFFSHIGWLLAVPHSEFLKNKRRVDTSDIERDWIVYYQHKYYLYLAMLLGYFIPTAVPWYFWNEDFWVSHLVACHLRHVFTLHVTFTINSVAHIFGTKPYDKNVRATDNILSCIPTFGEGLHNYHHAFPWDYRNAELWDYKLNLSTALIDLFAAIGWAYDLKTVPAEMVARKVRKSGDGTHPLHHFPGGAWGWNDKEVTSLDKSMTLITNRKVSNTGLYC